jgi:hypothetical protein
MRKKIRNGLLLAIALIAGAAALTTAAGGAFPLLGRPAAQAPTAPLPEVDETPTELSPDAAAALAQLEQLTVAEPHNIATYDRDLFGQRWADVDRNGCDTRNDMLARDLTDVVTKPGTNNCVVLSGILHDPYTGETVAFERRSEGYQPVQADHLVPLALGWAHGADQWNTQQREQFANDPANLQISTANQAKGDSGPAEWSVPNAAYACTYAARFVAVLSAYKLTVAPADHSALRSQLTSCTAS